jgi:rhamnosyltransferase
MTFAETSSLGTNAVRQPALGRVTAVIVTFHTGPEIIDNLATIEREADSVVVVDNGSDERTLTLLRRWATTRPEIRRLIENGANIGLAAAQNHGMDAASADGANWIWLFDDDSQPQVGMLAAFARVEEENSGRYDLLGPRILHAELDRVASIVLRSGRFGFTMHVPDATGIVEDPLFIIASGCLALLSHHLGHPSEHRLGPVRMVATNHSAVRHFFITRNRIRLWREYATREPGWLLFDGLAFIYRLLSVILFEQDRLAKLSATWRGALQALFLRPKAWTSGNPYDQPKG